MKARGRRALFIVGGLVALSVACALVLNAFRSNLVFFFSPSQIVANEAPRGHSFRLGGLVEAGSLRRASSGLTVNFVVTDLAQKVPVSYTGLLPDLFSEGKGVVAQGRLGSDGVFHADQVLAKHDENDMPPEAAKALADARPPGVRPFDSRPADVKR
jgi:cytochrome c-type biogenesis protein CcmE